MPPELILSSETEEKLHAYETLLVKWQAKINLVSPATLSQAWQRHFLDSLQLRALCPPDAKIALDLGAGAGFPGMVLAIVFPELAMHLVESDAKKCAFLQAVSRETKTPVSIHNQRIEVFAQDEALRPDLITARALASLTELLTYCEPWISRNPSLTLIFPKGAQSASEIGEARQIWDFDCVEKQSETDEKARILILKSVHKKG